MHPRFHWLLTALLLAAVGLFFWRLGDRDLWSSHEARAAMDAASLLADDGDGLPRLHDGRRELQKPPLFYWLVAAAAQMTGEVDALAVRLPAALSAAALVALVTLAVGWRLKRPVAGLVAGLTLATGVHFPWLARIGRIDMPLALAVTVASLALLHGPHSSRRGLTLLVGYLACAAGVLLKGPIGVVLPAVVVAAVLLAEGEWPAVWELAAWRRVLARYGVAWGAGVVLLVVLPVFAWMEHASGGEFSREFLWHHNVERGLGGSRLRSHPWWQYLGYLALYLLPATPVLLAAGATWRTWRDDRLARLGLAWLVGVVAVLSAAHFKRADYLLPAYPGAAIFLGCVVERWFAGAQARRVQVGVVAVACLMLAGWVVRIGHGLPDEEPYRDYRAFAHTIRGHAPSPAPVVFFRAETHALDFRVGRPLVRFVEWPRLQAYLTRPGVHHVVLPPAVAAEARAILRDVRLEELAHNTDPADGRHERPLVLLRACPVTPTAHAAESHARLSRTAADRRPADQPDSAGP